MNHVQTQRKLYIHIGFPKTGSSTIQSFLHNSHALLGEKDIFFPQFFGGELLKRADHEGHNSLVEADSSFRYDTIPWYTYREIYLQSFLKSSCNINILSSEALVYDNPLNLIPFRDHFDVKVICFLRNFFDYASSIRNSFTKKVCGRMHLLTGKIKKCTYLRTFMII